MHIQHLYYIHTSGRNSQLQNSTLYSLSAIRTVAQNTISIYNNTFFLYNVQVQTVHTIKCKAQAVEGHESACYQVSWKPLGGRTGRVGMEAAVTGQELFHTRHCSVLQD